MKKRRNVLVIGVSPAEFGRVAPFLARDAFDVDRFPSGTGALELTAHVAIEVLLVRYPLPDMDLGVFLQAVRQPESKCLKSPILLLAAAEEAGEAEAYIGRGANRVLQLEDAEESLQEAVSALLAVAPRKHARFLARMEIKLGGAKDMILCQTENLSASGMLIRTERRYDKGTRIDFEFSLPEDPRPITGVAEVVRHTMVGRDDVGGIGVCFLSFGGDSQRRFESYLQQL
ncbi:MAG: PilZ domain-containing protein [bacterium]|nr:PilZ domain-containing protein [bacterium]